MSERVIRPPPVNLTAKPRVLLVQSYHAGYEWCDAILRGAHMALPAREVELQVFYMDTKLNPDPSWKVESGRRAQAIVAEWKPRIVVAVDDNAQRYFATNYIGCRNLDVVFCGVNNGPELYGYPATNVTGILERPHFRKSLDLFRRIRPGAARIAIVTDDSETSSGALNYMRDVPEGMEVLSCSRPSTFPEWQAAVLDAQTQVDALAVYMYHTVKEPGTTVSLPAKEVMKWTIANSRIPVIGFFIFAVDDGALCGYLESGGEQGFKAGQMAYRILHGERAGSIPLITALEGQSMLNLKTARRLGLAITEELIGQTDLVIHE